MIEDLPATLGSQADTHLSYGSAPNDIPANLWLQFWILNINSGTQLSARRNKNKWFYVTNDTYPSNSHLWMLSEHKSNMAVDASDYGPATPFYWTVSEASGVSTINNANSPSGVTNQLGHNIVDRPIAANEWTLCKFNIDTSTSTPRARIWLRRLWESDFTLVMDEQHGVDSLSWTYPTPMGHVGVQVPSTTGGTDGVGGNGWDDCWRAMADFAIADSEADLPTYG
jgi:hypothetical protein